MRLKRRRHEERALTRATLPAVMLPEGPGPGADAPGLSARAALRVADLYACVRLLAGVASSLRS
jgi:hypothetical protein